jgi:uncharacterized protein (UPF0335 family)
LVSGEVGNNASQEQLVNFVERIERLEEEKKAMADDIRDVYGEAKANGYDTRTIREIVKLRKLTPQVRIERKTLLDTYLAAFGIDDE